MKKLMLVLAAVAVLGGSSLALTGTTGAQDCTPAACGPNGPGECVPCDPSECVPCPGPCK